MFQRSNTSAVCAAVMPSPRRSTSHASAMSCMSPYSIPLCTIFTKCPAPSGPTCVTHGPASVLAAIASRTSFSASHDSGDPPGISDGPKRAPSSPPDTPQPTKWMPLGRSAASRRRVSSNHELPPSMTMSPSLRTGRSFSIVWSTGFPAGIIMRIRRGRSRAAASASKVFVPWNACPGLWAMNSSTHSGSRFHTATGTPRDSTFSARFRPIVPSPITPNFESVMPPPVRAGRVRRRGRATGCAARRTGAPSGSRRRGRPHRTGSALHS